MQTSLYTHAFQDHPGPCFQPLPGKLLLGGTGDVPWGLRVHSYWDTVIREQRTPGQGQVVTPAGITAQTPQVQTTVFPAAQGPDTAVCSVIYLSP